MEPYCGQPGTIAGAGNIWPGQQVSPSLDGLREGRGMSGDGGGNGGRESAFVEKFNLR